MKKIGLHPMLSANRFFLGKCLFRIFSKKDDAQRKGQRKNFAVRKFFGRGGTKMRANHRKTIRYRKKLRK